VKAKTGKTWTEWFAILDAAGATKMDHKQIVALLDEKYQVPGWWDQMVTVAYEQARGLRDKHQKPEGYSVSVGRTMAVPLASLYNAWKNQKTRRRWLAEDSLVIRKATENKSLRMTWADGKSSVDVNFYAKGDSKSQVVVQHHKLPNAQAAARLKTYWGTTLDGLRAMLEA
jgi:uncharacterized protein YndB with AHSA1/START domain